jgi:hypothetical protein
MTAETSIFDRPAAVPEDCLRTAAEKGWPAGLVERAFQLRVERADVDWWLQRLDPGMVRKFLDRRERLMFGTMRVREATWSDNEAMADLYANSPEEIGDYEVTVERSPYAFAQFRLQEHVNIQVLEDRGIILAAGAHSARNVIIDGQRLTAHIAGAWRVRKDFRGQGMSNLLRMGSGPACSWFGVANYWYVRSGNLDAVNWIKALRPELGSDSEEELKVPGVPVTVHHIPTRPLEGNATGIRKASEDDLPQCVQLINRTHQGLDLFRPYSEEFLHARLDDPGWGPKPPFWSKVYNWDDFHVLEEDGRIAACAGLWDRGRDLREIWVHKSTGDRAVVETAALMDFGFTEGREDAMERLIAYLAGVTHGLGRSQLMAPVEQLPALVERLQKYQPTAETRGLHYDPDDDIFPELKIVIRRPYTDLAYW